MRRKRPMPWLRFIEEGGDGGGKSSEQSSEGQQPTTPEQAKTFTQDEVNSLLSRQKRDLRKEISDLQTQLDGKKTVEDRLADVEARAVAAEAKALRSDIAAVYGISAEDRDLFLTGTDEETLTAQAKRLAQREVDRKKRGNVAPKEGGSADNTSHPASSDMREFTRELFGRDDD